MNFNMILIAAAAAIAVAAGFYFAFDRSKSEKQSDSSAWSSDLNAAMETARTQNKKVLVDVYATWCGWCKKLSRDTLNDPSVLAFLQKDYVLVKLDAEDKATGSAFARKYGVRGYPTIIVVDATGKLVGSFSGYRSAKDFPGAVMEAVSGK